MDNIFRGLGQGQAATYQIQIQGRFSEAWSDWFSSMDIKFTQIQDGLTITTMTGILRDQAALHGLLGRIRDLSILLLSVKLIDPVVNISEE